MYRIWKTVIVLATFAVIGAAPAGCSDEAAEKGQQLDAGQRDSGGGHEFDTSEDADTDPDSGPPACSGDSDCESGVCDEGQCSPLPCDNVSCASDEACYRGVCQPICDSTAECGANAVCDDGRCVESADCGQMSCPEGDACYRGVCYDTCADSAECSESGSTCYAGRCLVAACADGVQNGHETDVDCGGPDCQPCATGSSCATDPDCLTLLCAHGACGDDQPAECGDDEIRDCYEGPSGTQGVGVCSAGQQHCESGSWGECQGAVIPANEIVNDGADNDCDGEVDEDPFSASAVAGGHWHACGLDSTGRAYCWGNNRDWQLGDTTQQNRNQPTPVNTSLTFDTIVTGYFFSCGLSDGAAYCWGLNERGQLGTGDTSDRSTPTQVNTSVDFVALAAGRSHACGLTDSGEAYCWGANDNAQIGTGSTYPTQLTPQKVAGTGKYVELTAGQLHTCGLGASGNVYCWGYGGHGQIGDGGTDPFRTSPTLVAGNRTYTDLTSGYRHNCAVASDGDTYCWGRNPSGQLGDGTTTDRNVPVPVNAPVQFEQVTAGFFHTCALGVDSKTYCWGQNNNGQIGDGTTTGRLMPVPVATTLTFVEVATMVDGNCARTNRDEVYCWGTNSYGQLGSGASQMTSPVPLQ